MSLLGSKTNITMPGRRREWLSRRRLLDLLERLAERRLVLVAAPPGYGKTALLVDFATSTGLPVCWLSLDALDRDPRRLLIQLIASIRRQFPSFGVETLPVVKGDPSGRLDPQMIATLLVNEVAEEAPDEFILILDDLQYAEAGEEVISILNGFIESVAENCHVILASRALPSLPCLPRMAASMQVGGISFEELAFQPDEIQALLVINHGIRISYAEAEELARESEGWITGLILSIQSSPVGGADQLRLARVSGVGLYEYLAQQVLDRQLPAVRDFLLRTAYLGDFNIELCESVFGSTEEWPALLAQVVQGNLFIMALDHEAGWYRYHSLFQRFLQETLARENPGEVASLLEELVEVYRTAQDWEKAYQAVQKLGDTAALADIIEEAGPFLARAGRLDSLSNWLESLPLQIISTRPALASLQGIVKVMLGEVELGVDLLDDAIEQYRRASDREGLALTLTRRTLGRIFQGSFPDALRDAQEALELCLDHDGYDSVRAEALRAKGISLLNLDQVEEAYDSLEEALRLYKALGDLDKVGQMYIDLGFANSLMCRYRSAQRHYELALAYWEKKKNLVHQATVLNNIGVLLHAQGDFLAAGRKFDQALAKARRCGYYRAESLTLASIGDIFSDLDDFDGALDAYQQAREVASRGELKSLRNYLDLSEAIVAYQKGEVYLALELISLVKQRVRSSGSTYDRGLVGLRSGQLHLLNQDLEEAISELIQSAAFFESDSRKAELAQANLLLAEAFFCAGQADLAYERLARTLAITSQLENDHFLLPVGRSAGGVLTAKESPLWPEASRLWDRILQWETDLRGIRRTMRRMGSTVQVSSPDLSIRAFGEGVVFRAGTPITSADWRSLSAREMFFCLLAHPDGMTKEALGHIFWPESPLGQMKVNFKNTIYRLRLSVGKDVISYDEGKYTFNHSLDFWYDVREFMGIVTADNPRIEVEKRIVQLQRAMALYEGDYLPEMERSWVIVERERLQQMFFSVGLTLGDLLIEKGAFEAALTPGIHVLSLDSCFEGAHRLLMRAHAGMGNRPAVIRQFERCRDALWGEFHTKPSTQTILLFESLIK